ILDYLAAPCPRGAFFHQGALMAPLSKTNADPGLSGKTAIVVGLGASGRSAVELLLRRGARVIGTDSAPAEKVQGAAKKWPCEVVLGGHEGVDFRSADLI